MQTQLKAIRGESKGKAAAKGSSAVDELRYLLDFNSSVCQTMAKSMEHLTDFVFVNMANTTLLRRDSYLSYLKAGVKADRLNAMTKVALGRCIRNIVTTPMNGKRRGQIAKGRTYLLGKTSLGRCIRNIVTTPMNGKRRGQIAKGRTYLLGKTSLMASIGGAKENIFIMTSQGPAVV